MTTFRLNTDNLFSSHKLDRFKDQSFIFNKKSIQSQSEVGGVNSRNHQTALHRAASAGQAETVQRLIDNGAKVNASDLVGRTPLNEAATEGHVETAKILLKNGAFTDTQDELQGNSPLHQAAWQGYSNMLEVLCQGKANVYLKNKGGFSPLHLACQNGHNQSCRVLLWAGCKPDLKNNYGDTPLHTAARYGHAGVLRILISAFCNVNDVNKNGDTGLHIAAAMSWRKLTKILLESRCDHLLRNRQDETAADIGKRKGFKEIEEIFLNPPPLVPIQSNTKPITSNSNSTTSPQQKLDKKSGEKRPDKDSGTSLGGRESESINKSFKEKSKKNKNGNRVHFSGVDGKKFTCPGANSPYGCPMLPNTTTFPSPKLDTLPPEPLIRGEQYFVDLAGNIRKGAIGVGVACYCAPQFEQMEKTIKSNKKELMEHIDHTCQNLKSKIDHLERRTRHRFSTLDQTVKEKLAEEKSECMSRVERRAERERREFEKQQGSHVTAFRSEMKSYVDSKIKSGPTLHHASDFARRSRKEKLCEASMYIMKARSQVLLTDTESINVMYSSWPLVQSTSEKMLSLPKFSNQEERETIEEFI